MHYTTDHGFLSLCWGSSNKAGPTRGTSEPVVFRHVAAGPRSGRSTSAWVGRAPSSTQWKPLLPMVTTSPQHQSKCTARAGGSGSESPCVQGSVAHYPTPEGRVDDLTETAKAHIRALPRPKAERGGATRLSTHFG